MSTDLRDLTPPIFNERVMDEAVRAMIDCLPRRVTSNRGVFEGTIWEVYRSITTPSVRIRLTEASGKVHHFNTLDIRDIT